MSETKPSMPAQPKTVELDKTPAWAIALVERVTNGFQAVDARLDSIESYQATQGDMVVDLGKRMTAQEERITKIESRHTTDSLRVKVRATSENDLKQDAAIAQVITRQDAHEKALATVDGKVDSLTTKTDAQTAMLTKLTDGASRLAANPIVRSIATMLGTAILTWLAAHGGAK